MFDLEQLKDLRRECELHNIDFSRVKLEARIDTAGGDDGFVVRPGSPLVDLGNRLTVPAAISTRTATQAEGLLLEWALKIQRAERQQVRTGRVYGWDNTRIAREPLTADELAKYRADTAHQRMVASLQAELAEVVAQAAQKAAASSQAVELQERYGLVAAKPAASFVDHSKPVQGTAANQVRTRKPKVRG